MQRQPFRGNTPKAIQRKEAFNKPKLPQISVKDLAAANEEMNEAISDYEIADFHTYYDVHDSDPDYDFYDYDDDARQDAANTIKSIKSDWESKYSGIKWTNKDGDAINFDDYEPVDYRKD